MTVSILETLLNADINLRNQDSLGYWLAKEQLHNAVTLLNNGYSIWDEVDPLLEKYGKVEDVPAKEE